MVCPETYRPWQALQAAEQNDFQAQKPFSVTFSPPAVAHRTDIKPFWDKRPEQRANIRETIDLYRRSNELEECSQSQIGRYR